MQSPATSTSTQAITLEEFLQLSETKPASEYIESAILQKPMPKGKHIQLQLRLCNAINKTAQDRKWDRTGIIPNTSV